MEKHRTIPQGFMTVGELAKKMKTTVRTLQYYDKEGLLTPSAESEGGRRLYTNKDVIQLHQIQSMKYLGFSLDDIKNRLVALETPADVAATLTEQAEAIRKQMTSLAKVLQTLEKLRDETLQMQTVDWKRYADIVVLMQMGNDNYWVIKHFNDKTLDAFRNRYGNGDDDSDAVWATMEEVFDEAAELQATGILPDSEQGLAYAKKFWDMVTDVIGGDMSVLPDIMKFSMEKDSWSSERLKEKWAAAEAYLVKALEAYFTKLGINPFEGAQT